jgi:hypothetical protein
MGQGRTEKRPGRRGYLASGQPPGADPAWRSGQLSAVCQFRSLADGKAGTEETPDSRLSDPHLHSANARELRDGNIPSLQGELAHE